MIHIQLMRWRLARREKHQLKLFLFSDLSMWVSVSPVVVGEDLPAGPALVTGVKLVRQPASPPQPIPAKTPHQLYPRVPGRTLRHKLDIYIPITFKCRY